MENKLTFFSNASLEAITKHQQPFITGIIILIITSVMISSCSTKSEDSFKNSQESFEWVFGDLVKLDTAMIHKVLTDQHGKRHYIDRDRDGHPEEVWFIDVDPRHNNKYRPLLVRAIDEDGDLKLGGQPDFDSDLYIADWNADGTVDAVIDYEDTDEDQDVDRMSFYTYENENGLIVWWSRDDGDDNMLWYDIDYMYYQRPCQYKTHFGGDESFIAFYIEPGSDHWIPFYENPFLFFDRDNDGVTEEVIRIAGKSDLIQTLRWGFDVDNDATIEHPRDFDVSISAYAQGWTLEKQNKSNFTLHFDKSQAETLSLRNLSAGPAMTRETTIPFIQSTKWARVLMAWDENDLNIAWDRPGIYIERWEGIIAAPSIEKNFEFPVIGGPHCGPYNKRYELVLSPGGPNKYYFSPSDHRIHFKNSDKTWIKVDYNYDTQLDMYYQWEDTNKNGIMDKISVDTNGDGLTDDFWKLDVSNISNIDWTFNSLNQIYAPVIINEPPKLYQLNKVLTLAMESISESAGEEPVWNMIENKMQQNDFSAELAKRLINSNETMLYYLTLAGDRRIAKLKLLYADNKSFWEVFSDARSQGNTKAMTQIIIKEFNLPVIVNDYDIWLADLRKEPVRQRVAWNNEWLPPNWAWESEEAAFRFYDGHFDLFGKRLSTLILPTIADDDNYHKDHNDWGMDILHVGETGGCGGLILYVDGMAYPIRNDNKPGDPVFSAKLLKETPEIITIEFMAKGVGPKESPYTVYIRPSAIAGRKDSPIEVYIEGGKSGKKIALGIGLNTLPEENFFLEKTDGIMGLWGFQQPEIGWIGTGVIFPAHRFLRMDEQPEEHRVVLNYQPGEVFTYHIQGDWLRGHRFSRSPGKRKWLETLKETANKIKLNQ